MTLALKHKKNTKKNRNIISEYFMKRNLYRTISTLYHVIPADFLPKVILVVIIVHRSRLCFSHQLLGQMRVYISLPL